MMPDVQAAHPAPVGAYARGAAPRSGLPRLPSDEGAVCAVRRNKQAAPGPGPRRVELAHMLRHGDAAAHRGSETRDVSG